MGRTISAVIVVALGLGLAAPPSSSLHRPSPQVAARPPVTDLLPDLRPVWWDMTDNDLRTTRDGRVLLRFVGSIANVGKGRLHVVGMRRDQGPGQGRDVLTAFQRIDRSDGSSRLVRIGTMVWHAPHRHFHLTRVAHYRLLDRAGRVVRDLPKVTFCMRDSSPVSVGERGMPRRPIYDNCPRRRELARVVMGISLGWMDVYDKDTPGQTMDVTDLMSMPKQRYTLEMSVNPDSLIREVNQARPRTERVTVTLGR